MSGRLRTIPRSRTLRFGAAGAAVAGLVVAGLPATPAQSAADPACPRAVPVDQVTDGMAVHGLTVTHGTTPDTFTGEVLGVLDDGIAPGLDMIMVRLEGSQITDADGDVDKGVWAGMSGSPVYTADGRLLGAVAYGLSWSPSDVAGVTPASEMLELTQYPTPNRARQSAADARRVDIPAGVAKSSGLTRAQASAGFKRLPMPFTVSGFSNQRLEKVADKFGIKRRLVAGSTATAAEPAPAIVPGGNLVASLSYGDITFAGIGTATAVCDDNVIGFGHPLLWSGHSTYSMHNAEAIYIQRDEVFGSFKVANPTAPLGGVVQDRLAGILGVNGFTPRSTEVTSHVESTTGNSRDGTTIITQRDAIPYLSAIHLLANADVVLDKLGSGSAHVTWTVKGTRADGSPWRYTRSDTFASRWDITFESVYESYRQLSIILHNKFERVNITSVHYNGTYDPVYRALNLEKVEANVGGKWVTVDRKSPIRVQAGSDLPLRVTLLPSDKSQPAQTVRLSVAVPNKARGGYLVVGEDEYSRGVKASSFDDLLDSLAHSPHNNEVIATLHTESRQGELTDSDSQVVSDVVSGNEFVEVRIVH